MASTDNLVDLHLHILPDVDDGVKSLEASVETVRGLYELGFSELVTTPHRDFQRWRYTEEALQKSFKMVRGALIAEGLPVRLGLGAEYTYGEQFHDEVTKGVARTIMGGRYVLLELPEEYMPNTMPAALFQVGLKGYYPILAHPERCQVFHNDVDALANLAAGRALIQVSFRSLAGTFGRTIKKTSWRLVEEGIADLVATDIHSPRELKKVVKPVLRELQKRLSSGRLSELLSDFPRSLLEEGAKS